MKTISSIFTLAMLVIFSGCFKSTGAVPNPWLVPFQDRHGSEISRSQMRAMVRLGDIYRDAGFQKEYLSCMITAVELYAGDQSVTFELLNTLIEGINKTRGEIAGNRMSLFDLGINPDQLNADNLPDTDPAWRFAVNYLNEKEELEAQYKECYRILSVACGQIPYNAELYYRTASLQYLRALEDPDEESRNEKYKDAINFLKRAIASDSSHLESYDLIASCYRQLGDTSREIRFRRLFEVVYKIAPDVMGQGFITSQRREMHIKSEERLRSLGESVE
ncbi:MAG: hypothetical protein ABIC40_03175 [bacterium]